MFAVHNSPFAGSWYPADATELEFLLAECFQNSAARTGPYLLPDARAYVVPHAGPVYSGGVAAAAYRSIEQQQPERIVVLAFPHRGGLAGAAIPSTTRIATPLGEIALDTGVEGFPQVPEDRLCDHSFEIQLPFLQKAAPRARITALYAGRMDAAQRLEAAERLAAGWRPGTVFVASSDFTHYGRGFNYLPFPTGSDVSNRLRELDSDCMDAAGSLDASLFLETIRTRGATVCGTAPIALLLDTLRLMEGGNFYQATLDYQTSGAITGDYHHSVSYAALGYHPRSAFLLDPADRDALLAAARETLDHLRRTGDRRSVPAAGSLALSAHRGVFVSLHHGNDLLGCVGNITGRSPLREEIGDLTLSAALDDPRFRPAARESGAIQIEISVLTPLRRIRDIRQFQVGTHGAVLRSAGRTALLLPQVAEDRDWTAQQFFEALSRKALLPSRAWRDPRAQLDIFEAQIFAA